MTRRVLRWEVPVDDAEHDIGAGPVLLVAMRPQVPGRPTPRVEVWTEENPPPSLIVPKRSVIAVETGHAMPATGQHIGSAIDPETRLVRHLFYARNVPRNVVNVEHRNVVHVER